MPSKIKDIVENGEKFLLSGEKSPEKEAFLIYSLAEFLKSRNKKVFYWPPADGEKNSADSYQAEIKIPKNLGPVGVSYEEKDGEFVIFIDSKQKIEKDFVGIETAKIKLDGIFSFNEINEEELRKEFILPEKEKIILMGPIGQISPTGQTDPLGQIEEIQLIGRALARTHYDENLYSNWTFLKASDFEKTKTEGSKETVAGVFEKIKSFFKEAKFHFIFWEEENEEQSRIFGFVSGKNENSLNFLANSLGAQIQSEYFFTPPFDNFSEAEMASRKLLKKLIQEKI